MMQGCFGADSLSRVVCEHSFQKVQTEEVKVKPMNDCFDGILRIVWEGRPVVSQG